MTLVLFRDDLQPQQAEKKISDITWSDFKVPTNMVESADIVLFSDSNQTKILKIR